MGPLVTLGKDPPVAHFQYWSLKSLGLDTVKKYDCKLLRIKCVCSTSDEHKKQSNDLIKRFVEKVYKVNIIRNQTQK